MRILMPVLWFNEISGGWTYFYEEAIRLAQSGHQVIVVCPHPGGPYTGSLDIKVYRCTSTNLVARAYVVSALSFVSTMKRVLLHEKTMEVVYDTTGGLLPFAIACKVWFMLKRRKTPILVHVHGEMKDLRGRGFISFLFEVYLNTLARLTYTVANRVIIMDPANAPRIIKLGAPVRKLRYVRVGTKYSDPAPTPSVINLRQELGLPSDAFLVSFVGRPTRAKGVHRLIQAFTKAHSHMPNSHLIIVGEEEHEKRDMIALSEQLGISDYTHFIGYRHDIPSILPSMDIFVNLTQSEGGISAAQIEAMTAGLPSIVTPFCPYLTHMKDALVTDEHDDESVIKELIRLYYDPILRRKLGDQAKISASEFQKRYSWDSYVAGINKVLTEVGS